MFLKITRIKKQFLLLIDDNASKKNKIKKFEQRGVKVIFVKKNHNGQEYI